MEGMEDQPLASPEQPYPTLRIEEDTDRRVHWCYMHRDHRTQPGRACLTPALLEAQLHWTRGIAERVRLERREQPNADLIQVVLGSDTDVFNLGGDLELFCGMIRQGNRNGLFEYARTCVEAVHTFHSGLGIGAHTISLVQGDALGGGFEAALSGHTVVAESGVKMGLPEVLFDLFPGMGAYSLLCKRVSPKLAERLMLGGVVYTSDALYEMGLVDVLAPKGEGRVAVDNLIHTTRRISHARAAMHQVRELFQPVPLQEMMRITEIWVDTAMQLGEKSLCTMERLTRAQTRRGQRAAVM